MKRIVLLGNDKNLSGRLKEKINKKGYSVKQIENLRKLKDLLKTVSPEFVVCSGKIKLDSEGNYYLEL